MRGQLTAMPGITSMVYDKNNRLSQATVAGGTEKYGYNPAGQRAWMQSTSGQYTVYFYGVKGELLATYHHDYGSCHCTAAAGPYVYFAGKKIWDGAGMVEDRLGSKVETSGTSAASYYPFGELKSGTASQFATYLRQSATGLDYAQQRWYSSQVMRFTSPDPAKESAKADDPQSWNRYLYVEGDPVNRNDPSGLWDSWICPPESGSCMFVPAPNPYQITGTINGKTVTMNTGSMLGTTGTGELQAAESQYKLSIAPWTSIILVKDATGAHFDGSLSGYLQSLGMTSADIVTAASNILSNPSLLEDCIAAASADYYDQLAVTDPYTEAMKVVDSVLTRTPDYSQGARKGAYPGGTSPGFQLVVNLQTPYGLFFGSIGQPNTSGLGSVAKTNLTTATQVFKDTLSECILHP